MSGRTILVSGGSRGLGAALVQGFLEQGDSVATFSRHSSDVVRDWIHHPHWGSRVFFREVDATDRKECARFVRETLDRFGAIDVLVNNAGFAPEGVLGTLPERTIDRVVDLNVKATMTLTKLVVRPMLASSSGRILNVSSVIARAGTRGLVAYAATKAALEGFTRSLAREVGSRGITVNAVAPGYLETVAHRLAESERENVLARTPLGRFGALADVVPLVLFLASPDAGFITGQTFVVDGGLTC